MQEYQVGGRIEMVDYACDASEGQTSGREAEKSLIVGMQGDEVIKSGSGT